jgi:hypothetical protein
MTRLHRGIVSFPRDEFLTQRWATNPGEHVTFCAPTQYGKTTLQFQILQQTMRRYPKTRVIHFGMKPRDRVVDEWSKRLGLEETHVWPPPLAKRWKRPPGWLLRPTTSFDPDIDTPRHYRTFRAAMQDGYKNGDTILDADEFMGCAELGLQRWLIALWSRGEAMGAALWGGVQKPSHVPAWGFNNAAHVFLANDPDRRNVKRFAEFGGIDPKLLEETLYDLPLYHFLYLRRKGRTACVVEP